MSAHRKPGLTRRRAGRGFVYLGSDGRRVRNAGQLARIRSLAIPPAWTDVWINPDADGRIQATGRDVRGRKQYRYHARWRQRRDADKYDRMLDFARRLPAIRKRLRRHLSRPGLDKMRMLAAVVRLIDRSAIRIGNSEYARANGSFGLTTLRRRHITLKGSAITLRFTSKGGKRQSAVVKDKSLAAAIADCVRHPGKEVFKYQREDGRICDVTAADVNLYLRAVAGGDFTAKDFRTWSATVTVVLCLLHEDAPATVQARKRALLAAIDCAAERLGNTRAICRTSYIHPLIERSYIADGWLKTRLRRSGTLTEGSPAGDAAALRTLRALVRQYGVNRV